MINATCENSRLIMIRRNVNFESARTDRITSMISAGYQGILATGISRNMFLPKNLPGATALCKTNHVTMSGTGLRLRIDCPTKWPPIHQSDLSPD